ncbi:MAG: NifU family protein [Candidatus Omnitrophica bacterium]|nr:NifU family protein [Candidatus Omnitrophota bacterium]
MEEKVKDAMELIRPAMRRDGGDVELVEVTEDGVVRVRLKGACGGCPMASVTLKMGIEKTLKSKVPEIKSVEAVS